MGGGGIDFRAILKSKVPNLARLDQPSFERIYQNFSESVGKFGLGDVESYYKTAGTSGDQQLQAMQERVAQQAAAAQPNQPPPSVSQAATSPEAQRTGLGSGTTVNVFSPEAARAQGAQVPAFSPELARAPSTPVGMDLYTNPEAGRTDLGAGTTGPPSIRQNVTDTADQNMLAMAEQAGAGTVPPSIRQNVTNTADQNMLNQAEQLGGGTAGSPMIAGPPAQPPQNTVDQNAVDNYLRSLAEKQAAQAQMPAQPNSPEFVDSTFTPLGTPPAGGVPPAGGGVPPAGGGVPPAGGVPPTAGFNAPTDLTGQINTAYDTLAQTTQEQFGGLQTQDFSDQIRALVESGRVSINELNAQQLATLQQSEARRMGQIGDIQGQLQGDLGQQEQYRQDIQQQVAADAATRAGQMTADQAARIEAARGALGGQVTSEFEEVAALTGGLTGSQALSTTAGMDRLATVANQGAASRLAAPAMLAAEAQMAVGDEKFRLENQLAQSLSEGMAELNIQEQQQVMQEAMRQEEFGMARDQALAQALTNIAGQRTGATLGEAGRMEDISQRQGEITQAQAYQTGETIAQRDWSAGEAAKGRAHSTEQARIRAEADNKRFNASMKEEVRQFDLNWQQDKANRAIDTARIAQQHGWDIDEANQRQDNWKAEFDLAVGSASGTVDPAEIDPNSLLGQINMSFPDIPDTTKVLAMQLSNELAYPPTKDWSTGEVTFAEREDMLASWGSEGADLIGGSTLEPDVIAQITAILEISDTYNENARTAGRQRRREEEQSQDLYAYN